MAEFAQEFMDIVRSGGVLMLALAGLAFAIYWIALDTLTNLNKVSTKETLAAMAAGAEVDEFRTGSMVFFQERRSMLQVLTTSAPLLGLLGTVMGMLTTFTGLADSRSDMFERIAAGISEAMITTETGLVIAIPALFLLMVIDTRIKRIELKLLKLDNSFG